MPLEKFDEALKCYKENMSKGKIIIRPSMKVWKYNLYVMKMLLFM